MKDRLPLRFIMIVLFAAGVICGGIGYRFLIDAGNKPALIEKHEGGYTFINPLLECDGAQESIGDPELRPFQKGIQAYVEEAVKKKQASSISVYFRDLTNGPTFGVNEHERYALASLLKVPLMIAYFKAAESNPALLKQELVYDGKLDLNRMETLKGARAVIPGKRYTVEALIELMIAYSDNNAMTLLADHLDPGYRNRVYEDLGLFDPTDRVHDIMSVAEYTSCFRILFNSSYLNRELSERALRYLAFPDFSLGIIAGVPPGLTVAQKFGERAYADTRELHDCGIVYYPNMPYLLCVMTKGTDYVSLAGTIRDISRLVFAQVDANQKKQGTEKH
jgi:beta-lactamase class A